MIKAVIFDFFGVVVTQGLSTFVEIYCKNQPDKLLAISKLVDDFNKNLVTINYDEFLLRLAELAETSKTIAARYLDSEVPNKPLLDFIRTELKPRYKIGILSNAGNDWAEELLSPVELELFDDIVLSYKFNLIKPDRKFYMLAINRLKVEPQQAVFVDDNQSYCQAAETLGMAAIHYQNNRQLKASLNSLLAYSNN